MMPIPIYFEKENIALSRYEDAITGVLSRESTYDLIKDGFPGIADLIKDRNEDRERRIDEERTAASGVTFYPTKPNGNMHFYLEKINYKNVRTKSFHDFKLFHEMFKRNQMYEMNDVNEAIEVKEVNEVSEFKYKPNIKTSPHKDLLDSLENIKKIKPIDYSEVELNKYRKPIPTNNLYQYIMNSSLNISSSRTNVKPISIKSVSSMLTVNTVRISNTTNSPSKSSVKLMKESFPSLERLQKPSIKTIYISPKYTETIYFSSNYNKNQTNSTHLSQESSSSSSINLTTYSLNMKHKKKLQLSWQEKFKKELDKAKHLRFKQTVYLKKKPQ